MARRAAERLFAVNIAADTTDKAPNTMTAAQAAAQGYRALTTAYYVKKERDMMEAVVADMKRAGTPYLKIEVAPGRVEIWRRGWIEAVNPTSTVCRGIRGVRV